MESFGRISVIFGQECTRGLIVGGSVLLFNRGIVRRAAASSRGAQPKNTHQRICELFSKANHCALLGSIRTAIRRNFILHGVFNLRLIR
jgi:hypothetical protein